MVHEVCFASSRRPTDFEPYTEMAQGLGCV